METNPTELGPVDPNNLSDKEWKTYVLEPLIELSIANLSKEQTIKVLKSIIRDLTETDEDRELHNLFSEKLNDLMNDDPFEETLDQLDRQFPQG